MLPRRKRPLLGALPAALLVGAMAPGTAAASEPVAERGPVAADIAAREGPDPEELGDSPTLVGGVEAGIFAEPRQTGGIASVSPRLELGIRPHEQVEILAGFGVVSTVEKTETGRASIVAPSNISIGAARVARWGERYREAKIGFAFALPTSLAREPAEVAAYDYALGGRSGWNPWEWTPTTLGLVVPASLRAQVWRRLVLGGDAALGGMFPSVDNTAPPAFAGQVAAQARYVTRWFGVGARSSVVYDGHRTDDRTQIAVTPLADVSLCRRGGRRIQGTLERVTAQCPAFVTARFNFNVDAPYGFTKPDAMRVWGLQVGLGWAVF